MDQLILSNHILLIARLIIKLLAELAYVKTVRSQNRPDWWSCMTQGAWA